MEGKSNAPGKVRVPSKSKSTPFILFAFMRSRKKARLPRAGTKGSSLLQFLFKAEALVAVLAALPYKALSSELTISARICAGFTVVEAFPAVTYQHLLAGNVSIAIRVVLALHDTPRSPLPLPHHSKSRGLQVSPLFVIDHKANRFVF
jgi:hypothetical protein